ncbi:hypothetical protein EVAR_47685_1 [Eumeta japonica]|uniref:Uncharacterized protein n=1 Tax=Eumeta variegata TaxID=151549 RepID=A0A4C1XR75_EUMVA|nr:hypothetical protein EVAR_47685_1 [Eumeta japonica]
MAYRPVDDCGDVTALADTSGDTEGEAEAEAEAEAVDVSIRTPLVASTPPARRSPHHRRQDTDGGGAGSEAAVALVASLFPSAVLEESFAERLVFSVPQNAVSSLARCFQQIEDVLRRTCAARLYRGAKEGAGFVAKLLVRDEDMLGTKIEMGRVGEAPSAVDMYRIMAAQ